MVTTANVIANSATEIVPPQQTTHKNDLCAASNKVECATKLGVSDVVGNIGVTDDAPCKSGELIPIVETNGSSKLPPKNVGESTTTEGTQTKEKWCHATQPCEEESFGDSEEEEGEEEEVNRPPSPAPTKVHIKDILTRIDKEIAQEKNKTKTQATKATNPTISPVTPIANPVTNSPVQQAGRVNPKSSPTVVPRPRIVVGQRPPHSFIKANVTVDQNNAQPVSRTDSTSKQKKHIEKLSRFVLGRPTSMELYRRNILREPGQDVLDKVQQFDSIGKHPYCSNK